MTRECLLAVANRLQHPLQELLALGVLLGVLRRELQEPSGGDLGFLPASQTLVQTRDVSVSEKEWNALPQGAGRSIRTTTLHVGMFKYIYPNHAFRDASIGYTDPPAIPPKERLATPAAATAWLKEAHAYLIEAIDELPADQELDRPRKADGRSGS